MKKLTSLLLLMLAGFQGVRADNAPTPASFGQARSLNSHWRFTLSADSTAIAPDFNDSRWQRVSLPHDWSVTRPMSPDGGSCQGYLPGGIGWYRHHLEVNASDVANGKHLFVYFEGVYNRSSVYLNGHLLGYRPSGFASFLYDLTPYLKVGEENVLAVRVDHSRQNDSRWYTGSGIYRPVWLISAPSVHLALWGSAYRLQKLTDKKAVVEVDIETTNEEANGAQGSGKKLKAKVEILDAEGGLVASTTTAIGAQEKKTVKLNISKPQKWTLTTPYLYRVVTRLMNGGQEVDRSEVPMGLRTLTFSPDKGFALNGEWMKVKGVCVHDDAGVLGTAVPAGVWKRRLQTLKQIGVNAIRMSHNPHVPAFYSLCDSLGLLVMDEASDEWEFPKRKWLKGWNQGTPGYEGTFDFFEEWIDRDVADMVRRDRCHPSIFLWSIGNEVDYPNDPYSHPVLDGNGSDFTQPMYGGYKPDQPNAERIGFIAQRLSKIVRSIDDSRAVTGALAGVVMSNATVYPEAVDVVGYNYTESRYAEDHQRYPKRIIYGSENRHDLAAWKAVRDNEHIFGQFLWTGIDYLGESGPWPARGSEAGLLDLAGNVKPMGHYRASLWAEQPVCYIGTYHAAQPNSRTYRGRSNREWVSPYATATWNYEEGQRVRVVCYTNAPSARLFLNEQPIGGEPKRDNQTDILYWDIEYAAGTLRCEAMEQGGDKALATAAITTCGRPYALRATIDKTVISSDADVAIINVEVVDENGIVVPFADNNISCFVNGPARLMGLENGNIRDIDDKTDRQCRAHAGRLLAYIGCGDSAGKVMVRFTTPLLGKADVELTVR